MSHNFILLLKYTQSLPEQTQVEAFFSQATDEYFSWT